MKNIFKITGIILVIFISDSCKEDKVIPPIVSTTDVTEISYTTATCGGNVTNEGGSTILSLGICWNKSPSPTIENDKTIQTGSLGTFTSNITHLSQNTKYYVRAYATNSVSTSYGNEVAFTTIPGAVPTLTTAPITCITQTSSLSGGNITSDNGSKIIARGVCWGTSVNPSTSDNKTTDGTDTGNFVSNLTGLIGNTLYYVRAYATNSLGTQYGDQLSFTTYALTVSDIDGNLYNAVLIGTQLWMSENLKTTKYNNGDLIGTTPTPFTDITSEYTPKYQWAYDGNEDNVSNYGRLYTWYAIADTRNVCPINWHVPNDAEWIVLELFAGMTIEAANSVEYRGTDQGLKLKSKQGWNSNGNGTDIYGFSAIPGGYRNYRGTYSDIGDYGCYWVFDNIAIGYFGLYRGFGYNSMGIDRGGPVPYGERHSGLSVRCLKD
jgi:uncharacterized protein (TIGR02145 family)